MTQPIIKLLLLAAIGLVGWYAFRGGRKAIHRVLWRGFVVVILLVAVFSILYPDGLTAVAHKVGVGRGADLLLYGMVVTFGLISVVLFRRLDALERRYVVIARALALREAEHENTRGGQEHDREAPGSPYGDTR
jgi:small membrane protein